MNHLGHFLLTNLLLDKITSNEEARIVNVSSLAHVGAKINFDDINSNENYAPWVAYGQSKLANIYFTKELAKRLPSNVKTVSLHPGVVRTELGRYMLDGSPGQKLLMNLGTPIFSLVTKDPESGAQTSLHCCLEPFETLESGKYYADCKVEEEKITQ